MVTFKPRIEDLGGRRCGTLTVFLLGILLAVENVRAEVTVPQTGDYVVDAAGVVDAKTKTEIEGWLRELEDKAGAQVKVLTVKTTDGEDFFGFVQRHYDLWKLGKKGTSKGALIGLAVQDHKARIQTGYGLEGILPDSWCGSLTRSVTQEYFKRGAYSDGLKQMVLAVANRIADDAGVKLATPQVRHQVRQDTGNNWLVLLFVVLVVLFIIYSYRQQRRNGGGRSSYGGYGGMPGPIFMPTYGGSWGGPFGGGSSGGGTFDGGSWGGGGSSGGGGGGASW